jgi:hypothetical protein
MLKPLFQRGTNGTWTPDPIVRGPFKGMQGGAAAALMSHELELTGASDRWGFLASFTTHFLQAVPIADLTVHATLVRRGRRVNIADARLVCGDVVCAVARATFISEMFDERTPTPLQQSHDPTNMPSQDRGPRHHDHSWLMDAMDVRASSDGVTWFRLLHPFCDRAIGPMTAVVPIADWAHGLAPPLGTEQSRLAAIPNIDVVVHLHRAASSDWIGLRAASAWSKHGIGTGWAELLDVRGLIGRVAMSIAVAMRPAEPDQRPARS